MSHSKSPYEIRSDLLHLAFDIVRNQKEAAAAVESKKQYEADPNHGCPLFVTEAPTVEDVVKEAEKLNSFVSQST